MSWFRKRKPPRRSPTLLEVEAEAASFRREAESLRVELTSLRWDISATALDLTLFAQSMRDVARAGSD